ncbi:MAG: inosine/xanthosine triphosphatase [Thermoplasmata archaeon HGW-Thermoplasmata-1]|nr:MAG: inosine/xanthosine triphosphatase [Thermoplasmata archaeon HGW-Thermoplasmata-1]
MEVAVGSENPVKVNAAGAVFKKAFPTADVSVFGVSVQSGVPEQPLEADVAHGARNRALAAIGARGSDYGVGIEAGIIFEPHMNEHIDVQYCCVIDKTGHATWGIGPGFCYPPEVLRQVNDGRTVGEAMSDISQENRIGSRGGAIGYLSKGLMDRIALTEQAVTMALIPRIRSELYSAAPKRRATC